jgi:hypothetical protein
MIHQSTRKRVCDKLLESLGGARRGGRELDIIICYLLGDTSSEAGKMIQLLVEEGYPWHVVAELLDEELPPYTTMLDAALPGENIVLALHSPRRGRWAAVHETPAGEQVLVWAASECLARRRAALKAMRATLLPRPAPAKPAAPTKPPAPAKPAPRAVPHPSTGTEAPRPAASPHGWSLTPDPEAAPEDAAEEGEAEWKILF